MIGFLVVGVIACWLLSLLVKGGGFGLIGDLVVGILGALIGGLMLGVIEAFGMHFPNPSLKALLSDAVFIAVLILRPEGLLTRKTRKA